MKHYGYVTFRLRDAEGVEVSLQLDAPWVIAAGVEPDVNTAIVTHAEFDKLRLSAESTEPDAVTDPPTSEPPSPGDPAPDPGPSPDPAPPQPVLLHKHGDICFYSTSETTPDHIIKDITLVDAMPIEFGGIPWLDDDATPREDYAPTRWRLWFADFRHRAAPNRTGRLTDGLVNPQVAKEQGAALVENKDLIDRCLMTIGVGFPTCPESVNQFTPLTNLEWYGAAPRPELKRLLEHCHHVFCPIEDINKWVQRIGEGDEPAIPDDRKIATIDVPLLRPGKTVIITSAPTPVIETYNDEATVKPTWSFVLQDTDGKWKKLHELSVFAGPSGAPYSGDPQVGLQDYYRQISEPTRHDLFNGAYSFMQLDPVRFPPDQCPLVRKRVDVVQDPDPGQPLYEFNDVVVMATIALPQFGDGGWRNSSRPIQIPVNMIIAPNVIYCGSRLGGFLDSFTHAELEPEFWPAGDISIEFSVEAWDVSNRRKRYFVAGFEQRLNEVAELSAEDAEAIFWAGGNDDKEVIIHHMPELQYVLTNGAENEQLKTSLKAKAKAKAEALLAELAAKPRIILATGFLSCEISGKVTRIEFDQRTVSTKVFIDSYHRTPLLGSTRSDNAAAAYPGQRETEPPRKYLGQGAESQPAVIGMPWSGGTSIGGGNAGTVINLAKIAGVYARYTGNLLTPAAEIALTAGTLAAGDIGGAGESVVVVNLWELGYSTHDLVDSPEPITRLPCVITSSRASDGKRIVHVHAIGNKCD